ncbi:hypothetical protein K503DRAFT_768583 [Rhizopogon vinicolor AM-OR11-026]|uniref:Uncharacterized protein n=1 Tax=Rhizopogon vinicolor AM-OR11-026 TaxID=1314800 RepID=A0A1B7N6E4_9AGAM|nr:hypothetical protein K503DRAFT_768583 [Rhizopogon vinicolor AM-OR11-026]
MYIESRVVPSAILRHHTQTMRFSFLVIVAALTASMSVSACSPFDDVCLKDKDCCAGICHIDNEGVLVGYCF